MRVLITNTGPWGTGSGTVADGVMKSLIEMGHEVKAFFPDTGLPGVDLEKYYGHPELYHIVPFPTNYQGVDLYTFPLIIPDPNPRNYPQAWTYKDLSQAQFKANLAYIKESLNKLINDYKPDVIECQHIWAFDHLIDQLGHNYICVAHHSDQMGFSFDERMRPITLNSAQKAKFIFAVSDFVRQEVIDLYKVNPDKVITITNGYDQDIFYPLGVDISDFLKELKLDISPTLPIITFCGKISHTKGIDILLQANHLIQKSDKAIILLIGSGSLDYFSTMERDGFCMENVHIMGHLSQPVISKLHNIAKLSVLPSRSEGFGIAALEAMGCGTPVISTDVGGLKSFVIGEVVKKEDPKALAKAILNVLDLTSDEYQKLSFKSLQAAKSYSWAKLTRQRIPYYDYLANLNKFINTEFNN